MGLDPGIDHMSAMQLIHRIKASDGKITSFRSHCGGLVAPESDNNPWHIMSENAINVTNTSSAGYYYVSGGNSGEDVTGSVFTIPSSFPKGYAGIYCMKYEITQKQYVDFFNTLSTANTTQKNARNLANSTFRNNFFC